uniref:Uncharacterized protein n=1 Tax=Takifugu rubripes TaxID=31033 RepID=A0A674NWD3_TAKRU
MDRGSVRPPWSPGALRPPARFPSPGSGWGFSGHRGAFSPRSPGYPPRSSPGLQGLFSCRVRERVSGPWGAGVAQGRQVPARFSCAGSQAPGWSHLASDCPVEKYFSASMLQDPWAGLQPVANFTFKGHKCQQKYF